MFVVRAGRRTVGMVSFRPGGARVDGAREKAYNTYLSPT